MAPEIMMGEAFDGFAIDLWGAGVILFMMLTGLPPYEFPNNDDPRYRQIARGGLERLLRSWRCQVSPEATDLVQNMLLEDPRERLSLSEVREHPWVLDEVPDVQMGEPAPTEGWRY
jgi:serine/threonine protein kinase